MAGVQAAKGNGATGSQVTQNQGMHLANYGAPPRDAFPTVPSIDRFLGRMACVGQRRSQSEFSNLPRSRRPKQRAGTGLRKARSRDGAATASSCGGGGLGDAKEDVEEDSVGGRIGSADERKQRQTSGKRRQSWGSRSRNGSTPILQLRFLSNASTALFLASSISCHERL